MTTSLAIQLLISFVAGGCFITLLAYLAENSSEKNAGIIMMLPSTIVLGYFFLGITTSAEKVVEVVPATLIPLGIVIFSSVIYIYCALFFGKFFKRKIYQITATFI